MQSIKFGNNQASQFTNNNIKDKFRENIKKTAGIDIETRQYQFLNERNLHYLEANKFKVCVNTFGQKYLLCLTNYNGKKYCLFINRKRCDFICVKMNFADELYENNGTLIDGELIKNNDNQWLYAITELILYRGESIANLDKRQDILATIFSEQFHPNSATDACQFEIKTYFECRYLQDVHNRYIATLPYKCSGLYFRAINDSKLAFMYIFPENRTNEKGDVGITFGDVNNVLNTPIPVLTLTPPAPVKIQIKKKEKEDISMTSNAPAPVKIQIKKKETANKPETPKKLDIPKKLEKDELDIKQEYEFAMKKTEIPDVYELYRDGEKIGVAGIPNLEASKKFVKLFEKSDKPIAVKCRYSEKFKKWIPN